MNRIYGLALLGLAIALITYNIVEWQKSAQVTIESIDAGLTPEFIAESLKSKTYNKNGDLSHIIDAQRMEHYADIAITHFEFPKLTLYPEGGGVPWQVSAKEATLYANNRVRLENRVQLIASDKNSMIQEIHGKYLELDLNTNIVSSEQTILILGKGFTTYGSGLIVDINTTQMTLTEHVQTIFKKIAK
ncbi:MAG: lipopolysaccharide export system protein LptC [Alteromonadaceae bacterium]|jgi:lipopolysaccharide export system protein LptC